MKNKTGLTIVILVVSACVLISIALIVGGYLLLRPAVIQTSPTSTSAPNAQNAVTATSAPQTPGSATTVATPGAAGTLSPEVSSQMDKIQQQVSSIRGLELKTTLQRALMTPEELKNKVVNDFFKDYTTEDALKDEKVLSTLGLIEPSFDLRDFYIKLYAEQIAGYYDSKTKEMYVIAGEKFGGMERMTYSHEFNHALQDQNYDMENGLKLNTENCKTETEYCAAVTALIEGDSTLVEQDWFIQYATKQDIQDLKDFQANYTSPVYDSAPTYMKEDFLFPYTQGFDFVSTLYKDGGWKSVDAAFLNPPVTTEQILHPEKYPADKPVTVAMPDFKPILGAGWEEIDRNVMGEWYTYLILAKGISTNFAMNDTDSKAAAAGWGGDTYVYYSPTDSSSYLFAWRSNWDTNQDMNEFFTLSSKYGEARWGIPTAKSSTSITWQTKSGELITMRKNGNDVLWLMGTSQTNMTDALNLIKDFGN